MDILCISLTIVILIIDFLIGIKYYNKIINPLSLFAIMFILSIAFVNYLKADLKISVYDGLYYVLFGVILFSVSFISAQVLIRRKVAVDIEQSNSLYTESELSLFTNVCLVFIILSFILSLYEVLSVTDSIINVFLNSTSVRFHYLNRSSPMWVNVIGIFLTVNVYTFTALVPLAIQGRIKRTIPKIAIIFSIRLLHSLVTMSKELFIIYLIFFLSAYTQTVLSRKREIAFLKKYWKFAAVLIVVLLINIINQRSYIGDRYDSYYDAIIGSISDYTSAPLANFCRLFSSSSHTFRNGAICFRPIINILAFFGIGEKVTAYQDVVAGGGNVYTIFGNMFNDFGVPGIVILSVVFGLFFGILYNNRPRNLGNIICNGIVAMSMFFAYYDLKIIQTVYLLTIVYGYIFSYALTHRVKRKIKFVVGTKFRP